MQGSVSFWFVQAYRILSSYVKIQIPVFNFENVLVILNIKHLYLTMHK